jgi:hypothetical protein
MKIGKWIFIAGASAIGLVTSLLAVEANSTPSDESAISNELIHKGETLLDGNWRHCCTDYDDIGRSRHDDDCLVIKNMDETERGEGITLSKNYHKMNHHSKSCGHWTRWMPGHEDRCDWNTDKSFKSGSQGECC